MAAKIYGQDERLLAHTENRCSVHLLSFFLVVSFNPPPAYILVPHIFHINNRQLVRSEVQSKHIRNRTTVPPYHHHCNILRKQVVFITLALNLVIYIKTCKFCYPHNIILNSALALPPYRVSSLSISVCILPVYFSFVLWAMWLFGCVQ